MTLFQKLTKPILMSGLLCLSMGIANAEGTAVYLSPAGTTTSYSITNGSPVDYTFTWDGSGGNYLAGFTFQMFASGSPDDGVLLSLYNPGDLTPADALATSFVSFDGFPTTASPVDFGFETTLDSGSYIAELSYGGTEAGSYNVLLDSTSDGGGEATPEPGTLAMMGAALVAVGAIRKHTKGAAAHH